MVNLAENIAMVPQNKNPQATALPMMLPLNLNPKSGKSKSDNGPTEVRQKLWFWCDVVMMKTWPISLNNLKNTCCVFSDLETLEIIAWESDTLWLIKLLTKTYRPC